MTPGTAGIAGHAPGMAATVGNVAKVDTTFVEADIDDELFRFQSEDTALMSMMLKARKVKVNSPVVDHYMIDEQRSTVTVSADVAASNSTQFALPVEGGDQNLLREWQTLLACGVDGYSPDGSVALAGKDLMLIVVGRDTLSNNPIVKAINGPRLVPGDAMCTTPHIKRGTKIKILANAMYETQKEVDPDLIVPQPTTIYLQKRGMNQVVSDYFDAQRKRIPFSQSVIAEQAILNFKRAGNRTLWAGHKGKMQVSVPRLGEQTVYFTEGLRWQFAREIKHAGVWTIEQILAMAKLFFTGEDVPKSATLLAGKDLLDSLQFVDFSHHSEIQVIAAQNALGWTVTRIHTVFGDIDIKREPTLDTLGWSRSGALIGNDRIVHYTYSAQHEFNDRIEGEEASRKGMVVWDGIALKGTCHIWIDGDNAACAPGVTGVELWNSPEAPDAETADLTHQFYLLCDCPGIAAEARSGQIWKKSGNSWIMA